MHHSKIRIYVLRECHRWIGQRGVVNGVWSKSAVKEACLIDGVLWDTCHAHREYPRIYGDPRTDHKAHGRSTCLRVHIGSVSHTMPCISIGNYFPTSFDINASNVLCSSDEYAGRERCNSFLLTHIKVLTGMNGRVGHQVPLGCLGRSETTESMCLACMNPDRTRMTMLVREQQDHDIAILVTLGEGFSFRCS